jgi:hypothetical protein
MANVKLIFCGDPEAECYEKAVQVYVNEAGKLYLQIRDYEADFEQSEFTVFDKETAIKFSKELRKQIALMD